MDNNQKLDLDAIFGGAGAVLNAAQNTLGAVTSGLSDVKQFMGDSRRNTTVPQGNGGYQQPVQYGYGYADTNPYPTSFPSYGGGGNSGNFFMNRPNNNYGGYEGFANPNYGTSAGGGGMMPMNRPMGGAWG